MRYGILASFINNFFSNSNFKYTYQIKNLSTTKRKVNLPLEYFYCCTNFIIFIETFQDSLYILTLIAYIVM